MSGEFRVYRPDGTTRETEFSATANFIRGSHLSILRDISDRKQTEARLQQQLDREQLVTQITDSIRQTLDLDQILQVAVDQVRHFLQNRPGNYLSVSVRLAGHGRCRIGRSRLDRNSLDHPSRSLLW